MVASLGAVVYLVTSSLPFLASSASADVNFGALNACAARALEASPSGFAVSPDARALTAYSGTKVVRCDLQPDGGAAEAVMELAGVTAAAFDFDSELWLADKTLARVTDGGIERFGEVAPHAVCGTRHGVVAVQDETVVAMQRTGSLAGVYQLPQPVQGPLLLSASADGERVALVVSGGIFVWKSERLELVRAESPCAVEMAWWLPQGHSMVLQCGPNADFALQWDVDTATQSALPSKPRSRSTLVPKLGAYVQPCEQLACTAAPP